jgi:hypothetical protein
LTPPLASAVFADSYGHLFGVSGQLVGCAAVSYTALAEPSARLLWRDWKARVLALGDAALFSTDFAASSVLGFAWKRA